MDQQVLGRRVGSTPALWGGRGVSLLSAARGRGAVGTGSLGGGEVGWSRDSDSAPPVSQSPPAALLGAWPDSQALDPPALPLYLLLY